MLEPPTRPTSPLGRLTWHLRNPLVALLAAAALFASIRGLPFQGSDSYIDRLIGRPVQIKLGGGSVGVYLLRYSGDPDHEFQIIDPNKESWDRLSRLTQDRAQDLLHCTFTVRITRRGMWYPIFELAQRQVDVKSLLADESLNNFAPGELARARAAYLAWLASPGGGNEPAEAALVAAGDRIDHRLVARALLKDIATVLAIALLLFSLHGMPLYIRAWIARLRIRSGHCGICKYDLRAIERTPEGIICPECGTVWRVGPFG